jgi:hypothetical protein
VIAIVTESGKSIAGHPGVDNVIIAEGNVERADMTDAQLGRSRRRQWHNPRLWHSCWDAIGANTGGSLRTLRTISFKAVIITQAPLRRPTTCTRIGSRSALDGARKLRMARQHSQTLMTSQKLHAQRKSQQNSESN